MRKEFFKSLHTLEKSVDDVMPCGCIVLLWFISIFCDVIERVLAGVDEQLIFEYELVS